MIQDKQDEKDTSSGDELGVMLHNLLTSEDMKAITSHKDYPATEKKLLDGIRGSVNDSINKMIAQSDIVPPSQQKPWDDAGVKTIRRDAADDAEAAKKAAPTTSPDAERINDAVNSAVFGANERLKADGARLLKAANERAALRAAKNQAEADAKEPPSFLQKAMRSFNTK